jgi:hypothetical protein
MKKLIWIPLLFALGCNHAPASLGPQATADFNATQVIKTLDLVRDAAIAANAQTPPLLTTATTRKVVNFHALALKTIDASRTGWKPAVSVALFQLMSDPSLLPAEVQFLQPYFNVAKALIDAVTPQASLTISYPEAA